MNGLDVGHHIHEILDAPDGDLRTLEIRQAAFEPPLDVHVRPDIALLDLAHEVERQGLLVGHLAPNPGLDGQARPMALVAVLGNQDVRIARVVEPHATRATAFLKDVDRVHEVLAAVGAVDDDPPGREVDPVRERRRRDQDIQLAAAKTALDLLARLAVAFRVVEIRLVAQLAEALDEPPAVRLGVDEDDEPVALMLLEERERGLEARVLLVRVRPDLGLERARPVVALDEPRLLVVEARSPPPKLLVVLDRRRQEDQARVGIVLREPDEARFEPIAPAFHRDQMHLVDDQGPDFPQPLVPLGLHAPAAGIERLAGHDHDVRVLQGLDLLLAEFDVAGDLRDLVLGETMIRRLPFVEFLLRYGLERRRVDGLLALA